MTGDFEACYRAVQSRDVRFDGQFVTAVASTGIYCRPSCPAVTPLRRNVRFLADAAAAQALGYRACLRCRPDAAPGSPAWDQRADLAGRSMRLIRDGVVDREGVSGLAKRLSYSERHLHRQLTLELGAGPLALARAQRARTARMLIETTSLPFAEVAEAAGFGSVRQFNDTVRRVLGASPRHLRARAGRPPAATGWLVLRLAVRPPFDPAAALGFLAARAVRGLEEVGDGTYRRALRLPGGLALLALEPRPDHVVLRLQLDDLRDVASGVERSRRLLDLDADPAAIDAVLRRDPRLRPLVDAAPGLRVPGHPDGVELAVRAVLGQQVTVAAARGLCERLVRRHGEPLAAPLGSVTHAFPTLDVLREADFRALGMPGARADALRALTTALAKGDLTLDPGADRGEARERLLRLPGVGPWTASYIAMRALRDPDVFLPTDAGVRRGLAAIDAPAEAARSWRP